MTQKGSTRRRSRSSPGISTEMVPMSARAMMHDSPVIASLVAGVAHEVNNPAAYVGANLAVLAEHVQAVERTVQDIQQLLADDPARMQQLAAVLEKRDLVHAINDARSIVDDNLEGVHRLAGFVTALKSFTRIDDMDVERFDANEVVRTVCHQFKGMPGVNARVVQELGVVPTLVGDPARIMQAVFQLVENALDAMAEPGPDEPLVVVRTYATAEHVIISVMDTGTGVCESAKDHIFEPFYSARSGHRGLGLCVVAGAAREHGGDVRVYSRPGEGARFDLVLPLDTGLHVAQTAHA